MDTMLSAIVFGAPGQIQVERFALGPLGAEDILVKTLYTMVSSGTELRALSGHYGKAAPFPLIPGYAAVGEVLAVGQKCAGFRVGDVVSCRDPQPIPGVNKCWGAQASLNLYSTLGSCRPVLVPSGANPLDYVITEVAAISLRGVEAACPRAGETAVVIGQGPIGAFSLAWLCSKGCRVVVTDLEQGRLDRSAAIGASAAVRGAGKDIEDRIRIMTQGGADIVVECSGSSGGAEMAYRLLRKTPQAHGDPVVLGGCHQWPRLVMQATYENTIELNPFDFVPGEGMTILAPKDRGITDRQRTVEAIRSKKINPLHFIDRVVSYREAPGAYPALRDDKDKVFSLIFSWDGA